MEEGRGVDGSAEVLMSCLDGLAGGWVGVGMLMKALELMFLRGDAACRVVGCVKLALDPGKFMKWRSSFESIQRLVLFG